MTEVSFSFVGGPLGFPLGLWRIFRRKKCCSIFFEKSFVCCRADRVLEKAMHKCVLKPLQRVIEVALHDFQVRAPPTESQIQNVSSTNWGFLIGRWAVASGGSSGRTWRWQRRRSPRTWGWMEPCPPTPWQSRKSVTSSWTCGRCTHRRRKWRCCCECVNWSTPSCRITPVRHAALGNRPPVPPSSWPSRLSAFIPGRMYGADDFLPMLTYVVAQCDMPQLDTDIQYMMELLDPSLLQGEGRFLSCLLSENQYSPDPPQNPNDPNSILITEYGENDFLWQEDQRGTKRETP